MWSDIWHVSYIERIWRSSKLWSSQLWTQFKQLRIEAWKSQDFNEVWTRDLAILVRCSNQLIYEATDVGSWSFVSSNEPVKNGYEMFHILNCEFENQVSYDLRSYECNSSDCILKPEKVSTSTGFEPVTSRYRCNALTNWAMKPLSWSLVHCCCYVQ